MDVRGWLAFVRDWLLVLGLGVALGGGAAFVVSSVLPKTYEAETRLLVGQSLTAPNPDYSQLLASQVIAQTYAEVATARPSLQRVIDELGLETSPEDLARTLSVRAPAGSTLIIIAAQSAEPQEAAQMANALAGVLLTGIENDPVDQPTREDLVALDESIAATSEQITALLSQGELTAAEEARLAQLQDQRESLRSERASVLDQLTSSANRLTVVEPAIVPTDHVSPRIVLNTAVGAFIGLVLAALAAYAFDSSERRSLPVDQAGPAAGAAYARRGR